MREEVLRCIYSGCYHRAFGYTRAGEFSLISRGCSLSLWSGPELLLLLLFLAGDGMRCKVYRAGAQGGKKIVYAMSIV